jgi:hypothetical protein
MQQEQKVKLQKDDVHRFSNFQPMMHKAYNPNEVWGIDHPQIEQCLMSGPTDEIFIPLNPRVSEPLNATFRMKIAPVAEQALLNFHGSRQV